MKKLCYLMIYLILAIGCSNKTSINDDNESIIINNDTLLNYLKDYYNTYLANSSFEKVLAINYLQKEDTNIFVISYEMNLFSFIDRPPLFYFKIDNINVAVWSSLKLFFSSNSKYQEDKLKDYFPNQYLNYEKNGEAPPPITYRDNIWILKFKDQRFISKEIKNKGE